MSEQFNKAAIPQSQKEPEKKTYPTPITFRPRDEEERQKLLRMSEGMSLSAFIRERIFVDDGSRVRRSPVQDREALAQTLALLGKSRIANNLNQLAYEANTGSLLLDPETLAKIEESYQFVGEMRSALIKALGLLEQHQK